MTNVPDAYTVKKSKGHGQSFIVNSFQTKAKAIVEARKVYGIGLHDVHVTHNASGDTVWYRADKCS